MKVILFDGVCNLCNGLVNWVIDRDTKNQFKFSSLQSAYGQKIIQQFGIAGEYMDTVVLVEDDRAFLRSEAVLRILLHLGYPYKILYGSIIVPKFIRDGIYSFIAKNRYQWFGKRDTCRIPDIRLKSKFLE
ncbi:MAG: hypothetical protein JWO06_1152 [Bacteroidota bacterium]|nr:hypothetical protein [Bacteroidota bacterium]